MFTYRLIISSHVYSYCTKFNNTRTPSFFLFWLLVILVDKFWTDDKMRIPQHCKSEIFSRKRRTNRARSGIRRRTRKFAATSTRRRYDETENKSGQSLPYTIKGRFKNIMYSINFILRTKRRRNIMLRNATIWKFPSSSGERCIQILYLENKFGNRLANSEVPFYTLLLRDSLMNTLLSNSEYMVSVVGLV